MKNILTILTLLFLHQYSKAQGTFYTAYDLFDANKSVSLIQTLDQKFMMMGTRLSPLANNDGMMMAKFDSQGLPLFHTIFDTTNNIDFGTNILACADSGFLCVGSSRSFVSVNDYDLWIVKTDKNGLWQWSKTIDGGNFSIDRGQNAIQAPNGSFIITGVLDYQTTSSSGDIYVINLSATGSIVWKKRLNITTSQEANLIAKASNSFYISGFSGVYGSPTSNAVITKMDYSGNVIWQKDYSPNNNEYATGITTSVNDACIVTTAKSIFEIDSSGSVNWNYNYSAPTGYTLLNAKPWPTGGYIALGSYVNGGSSYGILCKLDAGMSVEWIKNYGPNFVPSNQFLIIPNTLSMVLSGIGTPNLPNINPTCAIIQTDSLGNLLCNSSTIAPQTFQFNAQSITPVNNIVTTTSVGYIFAQYSLPSFNTTLNMGNICLSVNTADINKEKLDFNVYPNPISDVLNIHLSQPGQITVFNVLGQPIYQSSLINGAQKISTIGWSKGYYTIRCKTTLGTTQQSVIKE